MTQDRPPAGLAGTVDHVDAGNGWLVVRLMTKQALVREGEHMRHCLKSGGYHHLAGEEEMTGDAIWSLRDPRGMSRATLDVRAQRVIMAKGWGNSVVGGKAARRLKALVAAFRAAGADLEFNGETGIVVAPNGYTCREDQAPPEILAAVKARHRAAVEARRERPVTIRNGLFMTFDEAGDAFENSYRAVQAMIGQLSRRERPEPDLLAMTAGLPNPVVEVSTTWEHSCDGLRARARLRDGQVADLTAEGNWRENAASARRALFTSLYQRVLALQPPRTAGVGNPRRGDVFRLTDEPVTDVVVTVAGETLREGEDYGVDTACGNVEFRRDVEGQVEVSYRITFDPNRRVLTLGLDTQVGHTVSRAFALPWSEEPLTSDRVTVEDVERVERMTDALRGCQQELRQGVASALAPVEAAPLRLLPYQQAIVDALEPVYDPILPARMHQTEITCPEMPGARWVLTTSYGQTRIERA